MVLKEKKKKAKTKKTSILTTLTHQVIKKFVLCCHFLASKSNPVVLMTSQIVMPQVLFINRCWKDPRCP